MYPQEKGYMSTYSINIHHPTTQWYPKAIAVFHHVRKEAKPLQVHWQCTIEETVPILHNLIRLVDK